MIQLSTKHCKKTPRKNLISLRHERFLPMDDNKKVKRNREFTLPWIRIIRDESHGLCTSFLYRFLITFLWNFPSPSSIIKTWMDESNFGCPSITNNIAIYIYIFAVYIIHFRNLHRFLPFFKNSFSFLQVGILLK